MPAINIVIADDQALFVETLKSVIETRAKDIAVLGVAFDGESALELIQSAKPDVALVDVRMPKLDGVQVTKRVIDSVPSVRVLVLSTFPDDDYVQKAISFGASGYVLKTVRVDELLSAIRAVASGNLVLSPVIAESLSRHNRPGSREPVQLSEEQLRAVQLLSRREREVFELMVDGYSNPEIADTLFIAQQTVKNHISSIYSKIGVHSRSTIERTGR